MLRSIIRTVFIFGAVLMAGGCIDLRALRPTRLEGVIVEKSHRWFERNRILLLDVDGFIGPDSISLFGPAGTGVADVRQKLLMAEADHRIKAVLLRVNSPGGEAAASDMIHQEILRFRQRTGKPVVACLMGLATSGGYYVACAADRIVASPSTVTGSVGVIMQFMNAEGLYGKIGLRTEVIKSGEVKDIGSFSRAMTPEERAILQQINAALYARFQEVVRRGRAGMTDEQAAAIADGRIVSAAEALQLNMVDAVGYPDDALALARQMARVEGADLILYRAYPNYNTNIYAAGGTSQIIEKGLDLLVKRASPSFLYLWSPGG